MASLHRARPAYLAPRTLRARAGSTFNLETLEPRALFYSWTAQEVYFAELVNRARANPTAEAARLGTNLTTGLTLGEQALLVPMEPLALSSSLTAAARAHSADMAARSFFDHVNPDGLTPTNRVQNAGYAGTAGENIGAGYASIDALYQDWMASPNERRNLLSLYTAFDSTFHYDHIGPGFALNLTGAAYANYYTTDLGNPSTHAGSLLGVVYSDTNSDNFYSIGEGASSITVDVFAGSSVSGSPVATYTTDAAGNYQMALADGTYTVRFRRAGDGYFVTKPVTIAGQNVEVSAKTSELAPPPDDYANSGQWSGAGVIALNPTTGAGSISGVLGTSGDTDLFTFVATKAGVAHITGLPAGSAYTARVRVYNASQSLLADGAGVNVALVDGATYYLLFSAAGNTSTGNYSLTIEGPPDNSGPVIPPQYLGADGQPINPTYLGNKPVVAFMNAQGHAIVTYRNANGQWIPTDLQTAANSPAVLGDVQTWVEGRDGFLYAAARSASGVLVFKRDNAGHWTYRNLTAEILVSHNIVSNLTSFVDGGGLRQIAGLDATGHLVTYWMTGLMWPQGWRYFYTDVATRDLARRNHPMPAVGGTITSYVTQKNSLNVIGTDSAGHVILFFRPGGGLATQLWNWTDLTQLTSCAPIVGNVTASETSGRIVNISGVDASGNLWMITWRNGDGWRSRNATAAATGGQPLVSGSVVSWINTAGAGFVAGLTSAGDIVLYRYTFTNSVYTWTFASISAAVANPPALVGALRVVTTAAGAIILTGLTTDGQVERFTFTPGGTWVAESVSDLLAP